MEMTPIDLQVLIIRLSASFIILTFLTVPWIIIARRNWDFIKGALAGVDGITDAQELRLGLSFVILICFMIIYFFMIITKGALGWSWDQMLFTYTFLGTAGAEASVIISVFQTLKRPK